MKAHIVGGGFGGLAAAALLIRNAEVPGADITIYEADDALGGGFFLGGNAASGYNLPGSVFDKEFRCTFDLLEIDPFHAIPPFPSRSISSLSITSDPYHDRAHIFDRDGRDRAWAAFRSEPWRRPRLATRLADAGSDRWKGGASRSSFRQIFSRRNSGSSGRRSWGRCRSTARSSFGAT